MDFLPAEAHGAKEGLLAIGGQKYYDLCDLNDLYDLVDLNDLCGLILPINFNSHLSCRIASLASGISSLIFSPQTPNPPRPLIPAQYKTSP